MTDIEFEKAIDICEKLDFFGGCRAGRELWFGKPVDVQDRDIQNFAEDVAFLKDFIRRQQEEIERLKCMVGQNEGVLPQYEALIKSEAIREFADRLKDVFVTIDGTFECWEVEDHIDNLVKEMTEGQPCF